MEEKPIPYILEVIGQHDMCFASATGATSGKILWESTARIALTEEGYDLLAEQAPRVISHVPETLEFEEYRPIRRNLCAKIISNPIYGALTDIEADQGLTAFGTSFSVTAKKDFLGEVTFSCFNEYSYSQGRYTEQAERTEIVPGVKHKDRFLQTKTRFMNIHGVTNPLPPLSPAPLIKVQAWNGDDLDFHNPETVDSLTKSSPFNLRAGIIEAYALESQRGQHGR